LSLEGTDKLRSALEAIRRKLALGAALYQEGLYIQRNSMRRTPVDTGALRASHETTEPAYKGGEIEVAIQVGGPAAPYALIVHERLDVGHRVGEAKFLERSVTEAAAGIDERLARRIAKNLGTV
jgi:hypothetical protein